MELRYQITILQNLLTIRQVVELYFNVQINRNGFCCCPLHQGDRDPSFKIYDRTNSFYCFGCHKGGDVVRFVQDYFHESASDAVKRLDSDFALGLTNGDLSPSERVALNGRASRSIAARGRGRASQAVYKAKLDALTDKAVKVVEQQAECEPLSAEWVRLQSEQERLIREIENMGGGENH